MLVVVVLLGLTTMDMKFTQRRLVLSFFSLDDHQRPIPRENAVARAHCTTGLPFQFSTNRNSVKCNPKIRVGRKKRKEQAVTGTDHDHPRAGRQERDPKKRTPKPVMRPREKKAIPTMRLQERQHRPPCSWDDLADELVFHVASFLDEVSVARLGCTDHRTRLVCLDDRLWKRFYVSRIAASARFCAPKRCMVHRHEAHRDTVDRVRRWIADPSDTSCPLDEWDRFVGASLSRCGHHMREPVDHRWACAMDRALSDRNSHKYSRRGFARYPDLPYRAVGAVFKIDPFLLDFAASGLVKPVLDRDIRFMASYTGDTDPATGAPHGYGMAYAFSSKSGEEACKMAGEWTQGRPNGSLCVWAKYKRGHIYYEGGYADGRPTVTVFWSPLGRI